MDDLTARITAALDQAQRVEWPCPTVRALAKAHRIEDVAPTGTDDLR